MGLTAFNRARRAIAAQRAEALPVDKAEQPAEAKPARKSRRKAAPDDADR